MSWSGPDAIWGSSFFRRLSIPLAETWMSAVLVYGLDVGIRLTPESCISCRVIWARAFRDEGGLGLKTEWNCWVRALASSTSAVNVFQFACKDDIYYIL